MVWRLAWRNIWRNRRRTLLTMGAIFFAAVIALFTRSLQIGTYRATIEQVVTVNTGHLRIQDPGYRENGTVDTSFEGAETLVADLTGRPEVRAVSIRLESAGLASAGENTRGVQISGVQTEAEREVTSLAEKVTGGTWLKAGADSSAVLGADLARNLGLDLGDEVVLLTQTWYGTIGAGVYRVSGLVDSGMPDVDGSAVFLALKAAQGLMDARGRATSLVVVLDDPRRIGAAAADLSDAVPGGLTVLTWRDLRPELVQMIELDSISGWIFLAILLLVVGLGILNTVLMGVLERVKQFGVVLAIGMKPFQVGRLILAEGICIGGLALAAGDLVGVLLAWYYRVNPITLSGAEGQMMQDLGFSPAMPTYLDLRNFLMVNAFILVITLVSTVFPAVRAARYEPSEALRHA